MVNGDQTPSIEKALEDAILAGRIPRDGKPRETFWASSLGMCPRKCIAERAGIPPTHPADMRSEFKMWTGTLLGRHIAQALESNGYLDPAWTEKRLVYKSVSGKPDGVTRRIPGSAVVEIKTSDDLMVKKHDLPEHYIWQGMFYCIATQIPNLLLFVVGKNQGITKNRLLTLDDGWRRKIDDQIRRLDNLWELYTLKGSLPGCDHNFGWEDKYCAYRGETKQETAAQVRQEVENG